MASSKKKISYFYDPEVGNFYYGQVSFYLTILVVPKRNFRNILRVYEAIFHQLLKGIYNLLILFFEKFRDTR